MTEDEMTEAREKLVEVLMTTKKHQDLCYDIGINLENLISDHLKSTLETMYVGELINLLWVD